MFSRHLDDITVTIRYTRYIKYIYIYICKYYKSARFTYNFLEGGLGEK